MSEVIKYKGKERDQRGYYFFNDDFAFLNIPKNASTTLRLLLELHNREKMKDKNDEVFHNRTTFTVIRNPIDRIISGYSEVSKCRHDGLHEYTRSLPFYNMQNPDQKLQRFETFIDNIYDNLYDEHIKAQTFYLNDIKVDYFIIFDNLENEVNSMLRDNDFPVLNFEKRWNTGLTDKDVYKDFIYENDNILNKIKKMFAEDFELYENLKK